MSPVTSTTPSPAEHAARRRSIAFLNIGHGLDHYVMLIFPTVVIGLEAVYRRSYGDLIALSTASFTAFGLFALPFGWIADHWSRRNMMAIFYFGTGLSSIAVGLAPDFLTLAIALFAVGLFAAIYHPVGLPMLIDTAVNRGRSMAWNGMWGNVGVSVAAGCTALLTSAFGWRTAFFVPAVLFIAVGFAYLALVPDDRRRHAPRAGEHDVVLDRRLVITIVTLFMTLALSAGLVFQVLTVALPKIVDERIGHDISLAAVGGLATAVFLCGGMAQLTIGRAVERIAPHLLVAAVALVQLIGVVWTSYASGWSLLLALAVSVAGVYAQVTVNDIVLARYAPPAWRGRIYALRFFIIFTSAGPAVWAIGWLYDRGGFDLVLFVTCVMAALYAVNSLAITGLVAGAESRRAAMLPAE